MIGEVRERLDIFIIMYIMYGMPSADKLYVALNDRFRRRILALLLQEDEVCVCEFVELLRLPQPKVSRHLAILRDAGIVTVRRAGTWIFYRFSVHTPVWIYRIVESMAHGERENPLFVEDAARLKGRPVRHAEIDLARRKAACKSCNNSDRISRVTATAWNRNARPH